MKIIPLAVLFWLIFGVFVVNGRMFWPNEKWFEGVTNVDGLKQVFAQHESAYDRRYLIQAVPYFCKDHPVTVLPSWLVQEVGRAIDDPDPLIVIEGIIAAQSLGLQELSPNLARTYLRARQMSFEDMPTIHQTTAATLASFNTTASRMALTSIINGPQPDEVVTDAVPALRALTVVGDSTNFAALDLLKMRVLVIKDSLSLVKNQFSATVLTNRADSMQVKSDSVLAAKTDAMAVFVDRVKSKIKEKTGAK